MVKLYRPYSCLDGGMGAFFRRYTTVLLLQHYATYPLDGDEA